jgi:SAM-dependent methyltransferase
MTERGDESESLGVGLGPGEHHYRAYVGPPEDYDLIAAMTFNLLTTLGLRQHHSLLDIGCGSLRIGRLLIPYLNHGKYLGIEPNEWLVTEGIAREIGQALVEIKRPRFFFADSARDLLQEEICVDFALAQSIFSHCGLDLITQWLAEVEKCLPRNGALLATFLPGEVDSTASGWIYPECVRFKPETLAQLAGKAKFRFELLDWKHPRQTWALFAKPEFDSAWFRGKTLTWNTRLDVVLNKTPATHGGDHVYDQDGLRSLHNHEFMDDAKFRAAYERGVRATGQDYKWHWRVHVALWAASTASLLEGDFIECGVNRGFLSSAIMAYLDWDSLGKHFYLLDTFYGIDERFVSDADKAAGALEKNRSNLRTGFYATSADDVRRNFSDWKNATVIEGAVPDTLPRVTARKIAYLHIDMNCSPPEVAALEFFWDRLVPGALVLLDDYAYRGYRAQKMTMDEFARTKQIEILSLPTGQGLVIKPPPAA